MSCLKFLSMHYKHTAKAVQTTLFCTKPQASAYLSQYKIPRSNVKKNFFVKWPTRLIFRIRSLMTKVIAKTAKFSLNFICHQSRVKPASTGHHFLKTKVSAKHMLERRSYKILHVVAHNRLVTVV